MISWLFLNKKPQGLKLPLFWELFSFWTWPNSSRQIKPLKNILCWRLASCEDPKVFVKGISLSFWGVWVYSQEHLASVVGIQPNPPPCGKSLETLRLGGLAEGCFIPAMKSLFASLIFNVHHLGFPQRGQVYHLLTRRLRNTHKYRSMKYKWF